MTIVEFVEGYLEYPLSDWDKQFVEKTYESVKYRRQLFYTPTTWL